MPLGNIPAFSCVLKQKICLLQKVCEMRNENLSLVSLQQFGVALS